jgi:predicted O-methyltransferase YrrM
MIIPQRTGIQATGLQMLIDDLPGGLVVLEIGCYAGESARMFLNSGKVVRFFAVDTWQNTGEAEPYLNELLADDRLVKCKGTINQFIETLPMIDFVYIDGDHSYAAVKNDITQVLKILKPGGIIAGHDYGVGYEMDVIRAVDEMIGKPDKVYPDTSFIKKITL